MSTIRRLKMHGKLTIANSQGRVGILPNASSDIYDLYLPKSQGGASTYLHNDGSGQLSWATVAGGGNQFDQTLNKADTVTFAALKTDYLADPSSTRRFQFDSTAAVDGRTMRVAHAATTDRSWTIPDTSDTFAGVASVQTLLNKTLTGDTNTISADRLRTTGADVVVTSAPPLAGQVLQAADSSSATWVNLFTDSRWEVSHTGDATKKVKMDLGIAVTGKTLTLKSAVTENRVITFPNVTGTLVTLAGAETLTGKTLSGNTIANLKDAAGNTVEVPTGADTLANLAGVQTFSNKSWASDANFSTYLGTGAGNLRNSRYCTATGYIALANYNNAGNATYNTAMGARSLALLTTGVNCTGVGHGAGDTLTTGSRGTFLGAGADATGATVNDAIAIGYGAIAPQATAVIGNSIITEMRNGGNGTCSLGSTTNKWGTVHTTAVRVYGSNAQYSTTITPGTQTTNLTLTLPTSAGTSGQVLSTDGTGTMSWVTCCYMERRHATGGNPSVDTVNGVTTVLFDTLTADTFAGMLTYNAGVFTATREVILNISAGIQFDPLNSEMTVHRLWIQRNSGTYDRFGRSSVVTTSIASVALCAAAPLRLLAGQNFLIAYTKPQSGSVALGASALSTSFITIHEVR
jgi:hypothetical protein